MPDISQLPAPPVGAPPVATDLTLMGRLPPAGSPVGTIGTTYTATMGQLAPAIAPAAPGVAGNYVVRDGAATISAEKVLALDATAVPLTLAQHAAKVVTPMDFGAVGDGVTDDYAAFQRAVASNGGGNVHIRVTKPPTGYFLSAEPAGNNAYWFVESGVAFSGPPTVANAVPLYGAFLEYYSNGVRTTEAVVSLNTNVGALNAAEKRTIYNNGGAGYGWNHVYTNGGNGTPGGGGDLPFALTTTWGQRWTGDFSSFYLIAHSPVGAIGGANSAQAWAGGCAEINPVANGPETAYDDIVGANVYDMGGWFVAAGAGGPSGQGPLFNMGGHCLYGVAVGSTGEVNSRTLTSDPPAPGNYPLNAGGTYGYAPQMKNGFLVNLDGIAPGGSAIRLVGRVNLPAFFTPGFMLSARGNFATGIDASGAVLNDNVAFRAGPGQSVSLGGRTLSYSSTDARIYVESVANVPLLAIQDSGEVDVGTVRAAGVLSSGDPGASELRFLPGTATAPPSIQAYGPAGPASLLIGQPIVFGDVAVFNAVLVAQLPVGSQLGAQKFAYNGRKPGEAAGAGSGVPVFWDGAHWCSTCSGAPVAA